MKEVKEFLAHNEKDILFSKSLGFHWFELDELEGVNPSDVRFSFDYLDGKYELRYWLKENAIKANDIKTWFRCDIEGSWKDMATSELLVGEFDVPK